MKFKEAMHEACRELGFDGHIKTINYKKDAYTYAEKIAVQFGVPKEVKNSYMYLDAVDFCFYQNGEDVDFAIAGNIRANDKNKLIDAIHKALQLCTVCETYLRQ